MVIENWGFWLAAGAMALAVTALLLLALRRPPVAEVGPASDLKVYRDQLAEVERDLARGVIAPDEAERLPAPERERHRLEHAGHALAGLEFDRQTSYVQQGCVHVRKGRVERGGITAGASSG